MRKEQRTSSGLLKDLVRARERSIMTDTHTKLPCPMSQSSASASDGFSSVLEKTAEISERSSGALRPTQEEGLVGKCLDDRHPTLSGRVLVRWDDGTEEVEKWVPTLHQVPVRVDDRVLLMQPANFDEPIVVGVLDGFTRRPEPDRETAASLEVKRDESVRVAGADGTPFVELYRDDSGPVIRLLQDDVDLEFPSALRLKAAQIEMVAERGSVDITANDDVNVDGEIINLNC